MSLPTTPIGSDIKVTHMLVTNSAVFKKGVSVPEPLLNSDAATKLYVDNAVSGVGIPGAPDLSIQYNDGDVFTGSERLIFNNSNITEQGIVLKGTVVLGDKTDGTSYGALKGTYGYSGQNKGGKLAIIGGSGILSDNGGDVLVSGGESGISGGFGGNVNIYGGVSKTSLPGGTVSLIGGTSTNGNGGSVYISGRSSVSATGGAVDIVGGTGSTNGGNVSITAGTSFTNNGGDIVITGGVSNSGTGGNGYLLGGSSDDGPGGNVNISTGVSTNGNGGSINISAGDSNPSQETGVGSILLHTYNNYANSGLPIIGSNPVTITQGGISLNKSIITSDIGNDITFTSRQAIITYTDLNIPTGSSTSATINNELFTTDTMVLVTINNWEPANDGIPHVVVGLTGPQIFDIVIYNLSSIDAITNDLTISVLLL